MGRWAKIEQMSGQYLVQTDAQGIIMPSLHEALEKVASYMEGRSLHDLVSGERYEFTTISNSKQAVNEGGRGQVT